MSLLIAHACLWLIFFFALYLLKFKSWILFIFKSSFAGKRIPRTESGLVGGNCAGCNTHKAHKRSDELEKSGGSWGAGTEEVAVCGKQSNFFILWPSGA